MEKKMEKSVKSQVKVVGCVVNVGEPSIFSLSVKQEEG